MVKCQINVISCLLFGVDATVFRNALLWDYNEITACTRIGPTDDQSFPSPPTAVSIIPLVNGFRRFSFLFFFFVLLFRAILDTTTFFETRRSIREFCSRIFEVIDIIQVA